MFLINEGFFMILSFCIFFVNGESGVLLSDFPISDYNVYAWGLFFIAPLDFKIVGLRTPSYHSSSFNQRIEVVLFNTNPVLGPTTDFISIFRQIDFFSNETMEVNIDIMSGNIIGVFGYDGYGGADSSPVYFPYRSNITKPILNSTVVLRSLYSNNGITLSVSVECCELFSYASYGFGVIEIRYCDIMCFKCRGENGTICLDCGNDFLLGGKCYSDCSEIGGYFNDYETTPRTCGRCEQNCEDCISEDACEKCSNNFYLFNSDCFQDCSTLGFYYNNNDANPPQCSLCPSPCISCVNESFCLDCSNQYLLQGQCVLECGEYGPYYNDDGNPRMCLSCSNLCMKCIDFDTCSNCTNGKFLISGECVDDTNVEDDTNIDDTDVDDTNIDDTNVDDTNIDDTNVDDTNMDDTNVDDTNIDDTNVEDTNIDDTNVDDTNIDDTNVDNTVPWKSNEILMGVLIPVGFFCLVLFVIAFIAMVVVIFILKKKLSKYKNFEKEEEIQLKEMANLVINQKMFEIDYSELEIKKVLGSGGSNSKVLLAFWNKKEIAFKSYNITSSDQGKFDAFG